MDILMLTTVFPPEVRSAAQIMWELAESLNRRGHRVTVVTALTRSPGPAEGSLLGRFVKQEELEGMRVIRVSTLPIHQSGAPAVVRGIGQLLNSAGYLIASLAIPRPDVSIAYSPPLALGIVGAALHRLRGVPHVLNVQDLVPKYAVDLGLLKNPTLIALLKWLEHAVYRNVQAISVHSSGNAAYLAAEGVPGHKITIVENWVDTQHVRPAPRDTAYRRHAGLQDKFVALFAGVLGFAQDVDTLIEAGQHLRAHPDIVIAIVGEGVEKPRLQAKANALGLDNVRFLPFVSQEHYPEVVASADVCLAALQKSLECPVVPSKLLGYMAAGRPIITCFPEHGDAPRVIAEAGCGINVPPGEPERLAQAILTAYQHPADCQRWGERGRRYVETHHDRERAVTLVESLFWRLAHGDAALSEGSPAEPEDAAAGSFI